MSNKTFVINDASLNSHGFRVVTSGINLSRFKKNPVMLYGHDREKGVIGRWENLRVDGDKLLADPVFDENDPIGRTVKDKVDNGFLNSVSMGIEVLDMKTIDGVDTAIQSVLHEISIADIPSNQNAVKLHFKLSDKLDQKRIKETILEILNLPLETSDAALFEALRNIVEERKESEDGVEKALKAGLINKTEIHLLKTIQKHDPQAFKAHMVELEQQQKQKKAAALSLAVSEGRLIRPEVAKLLEISQDVGLNTLNTIIELLPRNISLSQLVRTKGCKSYWGLNEYRRLAPEELENNPELYRSLLEKEKKTTTYGKDLDWYRKNDPEYLLSNPDVYKQLLDKEFNKNKY